MNITVTEVTDSHQKGNICNSILRALPDWFGLESSIVEYVNDVKEMPFYASFVDDIAVGFVAIKTHNEHTCEVYVMGILSQYHRIGIGKKLIEICKQYCRDCNMSYLTVKTLDESRDDDAYKKTRLFYLNAGFCPLEVFPTLWDKDNPCLFMALFIN